MLKNIGKQRYTYFLVYGTKLKYPLKSANILLRIFDKSKIFRQKVLRLVGYFGICTAKHKVKKIVKSLKSAIELAMQEARYQRNEVGILSGNEEIDTEAFAMLTRVIEKLQGALDEITPF